MGSSSVRLGIILKKAGMTAARGESRKLASASLILRVEFGRICGEVMALDRVSRYVRKTHCVGGRHIAPNVWEKSRGRRCDSMLDSILV